MPLDRQWIERHIPHQGTMCLLDEVLTWNTQRVQCRSSTHRNRANPLRAHDRLGAVCGIEYAAQAMAVHGALIVPPSSVSSIHALSTQRRWLTSPDTVISGEPGSGARRASASDRPAHFA